MDLGEVAYAAQEYAEAQRDFQAGLAVAREVETIKWSYHASRLGSVALMQGTILQRKHTFMLRFSVLSRRGLGPCRWLVGSSS